MVDIDGQAQVLQTIAKAVQIIGVQVSIDGVATALLNASLDLSGAARGAAVLAAKGALLLGESAFEPGVPLVAKLKPDGELKDLPMDLLRTVHETRGPNVELFVVAGRQYSPALDAFVKACRSLDWRAQLATSILQREAPNTVPNEAVQRRARQEHELRLSA